MATRENAEDRVAQRSENILARFIGGPRTMARKPISKRTRPRPKAVLRLPDLDQAKSAVLNSLTSTDAQRGYRHAIDEFVDW